MRIERESETDHIVLLTLSETGWAIWYNKVVVRHPLQDDLDVRWLSVGVLVRFVPSSDIAIWVCPGLLTRPLKLGDKCVPFWIGCGQPILKRGSFHGVATTTTDSLGRKT